MTFKKGNSTNKGKATAQEPANNKAATSSNPVQYTPSPPAKQPTGEEPAEPISTVAPQSSNPGSRNNLPGPIFGVRKATGPGNRGIQSGRF